MVFDLFQETAYPDQAIGRSILGPEHIVEAMPREALLDYVKDHYAGARMLLSASGKVEHEAVVRLAEDLLGDLPAGTPAAIEPAAYRGGERREARDLEQVHICLGVEAFAYTDPDYYALQVFCAALGGGMSSRLFQNVREDLGLCYSIYSFTDLYRDSGVLGVYAGTGAEDVGRMMPVICDEMRHLAETIGPVELARAKAQMKAGQMMALEGCLSVCQDMAGQHLCFGDRLSAAELAARIEAVDRDAIERVGHRLFHGRTRPTLTAIGPEKGLPDMESLKGL